MVKAYRLRSWILLMLGMLFVSPVFAHEGIFFKVPQPKFPESISSPEACFHRILNDGEIFITQDTNKRIEGCCPECVKRDPAFVQKMIRSLNARVVRRCARQAKGVEPVLVEYRSSTPCVSSPFWRYERRANDVSYLISPTAEGAKIKFKARFDIRPRAIDREHASFMLRKTRECVPYIRKLWKNYAIDLDIDIDSDREPQPGEPNYTAFLYGDHEGERRSNTAEFYFWGMAFTPGGVCMTECLNANNWDRCADFCEDRRQESYCLMVVHEFAHWLGLDDEYSEPNACPDRARVAPEIKPTSVMGDHYMGWEQIEIMPRHILGIVKPLCD